MRSMRSNIRALLAARALVLAFVALGGCNSEQVEPPTTTKSESSDPGTTTASASSSGTAEVPTTGGSEADSTAGETTVDPTGDTTDSTTGAVDCEGPDGCFDCKPSKSVELLNACGDASCEPFANTVERLPLLGKDGKLPPLP